MRKEIPAPGLPERGDAAAGAAEGVFDGRDGRMGLCRLISTHASGSIPGRHFAPACGAGDVGVEPPPS